VKFKVGEEGPEVIAMEPDRGFGSVRVIELDRGPTEGLREEDPEDGIVGVRGCWRILLKPDVPSPCSCSVMTGDLMERFG
jgi:hypothetical protein